MNKKIIILICIILVMIGGIVGYIIFDSLNKKNENPNDTTTTTTKIKEKEYQDWSEYYAEDITKIYFSCINEDASKECILNEEGIKLSIKKENKNNLLYINDVKSSFIEQLVIESHFNIKYVEKVDNDTIFVTIEGFDGDMFYLINKDGQKITDFSNVSSLTSVNDVAYKEGKFILFSTRYLPDYEASLCRDYNDTDYAYMSEEFEYLGNGMFSESIISETKTVDEVIRERFGLTCTELKNSTDPRLEYHISLAKGEQ